jgi:hypothetical protein
MCCLALRPIHTFSLSNQKCVVDITNDWHLENKWRIPTNWFAGGFKSEDCRLDKAENQPVIWKGEILNFAKTNLSTVGDYTSVTSDFASVRMDRFR